MESSRFRFSNVILFLSLLMFTLISHTIYAWTIGLFLLGLYFILEKIQVREKPFIEAIVLFLLLFISVFRFQIFLVDIVLPTYSDAFVGVLSGYVLSILTWLFVRALLISNHRQIVISLLTPLLWTHVSAFFLQFVVYLLTGKFLDFVEPFVDTGSRYGSFAQSISVYIGSIRPTGLLVEPSTYSCIVLALAILIIIHKEFRYNKLLIILTIVSMYLSFSTAAVIIASIFVIYLFFSEGIKFKNAALVLVIGSAVAFYAGGTISKLYLSQELKYNNSSGVRENLITKILDRDPNTAILAIGPFAVDKSITYSTTSDIGDNSVASLNDSGLLVFLWLEFGYLGIGIFLLLCYWQYRLSKRNLILFLILSLTKINPFLPFFALFFAVSIMKYSIGFQSVRFKANRKNKLLFGKRRLRELNN